MIFDYLIKLNFIICLIFFFFSFSYFFNMHDDC